MLVAIIDYGSGNLRSAAKAFERVSAATGHSVIVTSNPADLAKATHIVLPGVGAFADCMRGLEAVPGMRTALEENVRGRLKPFLGICVGMQMLFDSGHEHGTHKGLGWIGGEVVKIGNGESGMGIKNPASPIPNPHALKVPHMGWNNLTLTHPTRKLLRGIKNGEHVYFVHSYHALCKNPAEVLATTDYGIPITAIVAKGNIMGMQFHPEKSQETGLRLIGNFLRLEAWKSRRQET